MSLFRGFDLLICDKCHSLMVADDTRARTHTHTHTHTEEDKIKMFIRSQHQKKVVDYNTCGCYMGFLNCMLVMVEQLWPAEEIPLQHLLCEVGCCHPFTQVDLQGMVSKCGTTVSGQPSRFSLHPYETHPHNLSVTDPPPH